MRTNLHTHTTFCDGKSTPEEIVTYAIENGFDSVGFSGHGHTPFDFRYCMMETDKYIEEVNRLKKVYKDKIEIYLGIEEDAFSWCDRSKFDYIIGSSHYFRFGEKYFSIDGNYDYFKKCLEAFNYDILKLSEVYYQNFHDYIKKRRPDIIGHFDVITKFDKIDVERFLNSDDYNRIAEKYAQEIVKYGCIFEVNTGVISRGYRDFPHPSENLLYVIRQNGGNVTISSDCHELKNLNANFDETKKRLKDIGFEYIWVLYNNEFIKDYL